MYIAQTADPPKSTISRLQTCIDFVINLTL